MFFIIFAGEGYVTVKIKEIKAKRLAHIHPCEIAVGKTCVPVVKLWINKREYPTNIVKTETELLKTPNNIVTSELVPHDANIAIQVLHDGKYPISYLDRNIGVFMKTPIYENAGYVESDPNKNRLVTTVFWKDVYNYMDCATEVGEQIHRKKCRKVPFVGQ